MAIVFISPKKRQKSFFLSITGFLVLVVITISLVTFLPEIQNRFNGNSINGILSIPDVQINFAILDSNKVKNLALLEGAGAQFAYVAKNKIGKQITGNISALNRSDATTHLEGMGLIISSLEETKIGRSDPFTSY